MGELSEGVGSAKGAAIVEVEDLIKRYRKGKTNAVDGISFTVRKVEFFAFLGPDGAGKTTMPPRREGPDHRRRRRVTLVEPR